MIGYSAIAAAYVALLGTLAIMFAIYVADVAKLWPRRSNGVFTLAIALAVLAAGLLVDQTTFTLSNIDRAIYGHRGLRLSQWIAIHMPWLIVGSKATIALGCLIHVWLKVRERWPEATVSRMFMLWALIWAVLFLGIELIAER